MLIAILSSNQTNLDNYLRQLGQQYPFKPLQVVATVHRTQGVTQRHEEEGQIPFPANILEDGPDVWNKAVCIASELISRMIGRRLEMPAEQIPTNLGSPKEMLEAWAPHIYSGWQRIIDNPNITAARRLIFASKLLDRSLFAEDPLRFPFTKNKFVHRYPCIDEIGQDSVGETAVICFVNVTTQEAREEKRFEPRYDPRSESGSKDSAGDGFNRQPRREHRREKPRSFGGRQWLSRARGKSWHDQDFDY